MPQQTKRTKLGSLDLDEGNESELDLPTNHLMKRLFLQLDWDVDSVSGDSQSGTGALEILQNLRIEINNQRTLKSLGLPLLHKLTHYRYGSSGPTHDTINFGGGSGQTGTITAMLDFVHWPGSLVSALPTWDFDDLSLKARWGTASDVGDGTNTTLNSGTTLKVESHSIPRHAVPNLQASDPMAFHETEKIVSIDSSGVTTVELPRGRPYTGIAMLILDGDSPDDALVSSYDVVEDDTHTHRAVDFDMSQEADKTEYSINSKITGFTVADFGEKADLSKIVPTKQMGTWDLDLDTEGTSPTDPAEARVVAQTIIP